MITKYSHKYPNFMSKRFDLCNNIYNKVTDNYSYCTNRRKRKKKKSKPYIKKNPKYKRKKYKKPWMYKVIKE